MSVTIIDPTAMKLGDVLLYYGVGLVSNLIRLFDGTEYSHASIWQGSHVVEALSNGITANTLAASVAGAKFVDVYRFISTDGAKPLGSPDYPADPVIAQIAYFEAHHERYAYEQLLLLALLASTRRLPIPGLGLILRPILDHAADVLANIIAGGREPVICSELVYRCYLQAGDKYFIRIRGADVAALESAALLAPPQQGAPPPAATADLPAAADAAFQEDASVFLQNYFAAKAASAPVGAEAATAEAVANFVTPGDLKKSPNMQKAGTLRLA